MYRRADKGWLYFVDQTAQRIHVVDESNANYLFNIELNHEPNRDSDKHKQTVYLIWWQPAEGIEGEAGYRAGQLQGLLESKLSKRKNGDWYVKLGDGEMPASGTTITPVYSKKLKDGGNTVGVYTWRRATFMTKWNNTATDNQGLDRLSVLNLETGKEKPLASYSFESKIVGGVDYPARDYLNVRAIAIAENDNELMTEVPAAKESTVPADYDDNDVNTAQSNNELVNQTLPENTETVPSTEVIESTPVIAQTDSVNPDSDFESTELTQEEPKEQAFHVVVKGDNLYGISVKYNIQIKALRRWNALDDKASIRIGDKIYIEKPVTEISSDE